MGIKIKSMKWKNAIITVFILLSSLNLQAQKIILPRFFADSMVIQRETKAPVWGWTTAGTTVEVTGSWNNVKVVSVADAKGKFMVNLDTPVAGGPYTIKLIAGTTVKTIVNVLSGEVWICSGQSNMALRLFEADLWQVASDNNPQIRFFVATPTFSSTPQDTLQAGSWRYGAMPGNMQNVSATGYYFARRLQEVLKIPIGMLSLSQGATNIEEWTNPDVMANFPEILKDYTVPATGRIAGCFYNAMIHPVIPYKVAGFIWYQGENNVERIQHYDKNLKALIADWRNGFLNNQLPFYLVQLPTYWQNWMEFREVQEGIVNTTKNTGMAVTIDIGDNGTVHPTTKKPVGDRLGDIALAKDYGQTALSFSSPVFRSVLAEGNRMRVFFNYADKGLKLKSGTSPLYFEIAGADGTYYDADARIEGNTVLVSAAQVAIPVSVRYFWKSYAVPNLFSTDGLPVAPFRSKK
jgi:sialate O-acetylesterase